MKFLHISDLHLGKRVYEFSMIEEQRDILGKIIEIAEEQKVEAVLIAGDVYDRQVPPAEAVGLFDWFLTELARRRLSVFVISGNHDSAERLAFGAKLMARERVYVSPVFDGKIEPVLLEDEAGEIAVYLLPFLKPVQARQFYPEAEIADYDDAVRVVLEHLELNPNRRNLLVAHQFVTGAKRSESEELFVGGMDNVSAEYFEIFDYTALGHIHGPQNMGRESIRYCGTPLKYSFSEAGHQKSVTIAELPKKGELHISTAALTPKRDLREIRGTYMELTDKAYYAGTETEDYLHVTLTDEQEIPEAVRRLRTIYPHIMKLDYDNARTQAGQQATAAEQEKERTPFELFEAFYRMQNNQTLDAEQTAYLKMRMEELWEVEP